MEDKKYEVLSEDAKKRNIANENSYEQYNMVVNFTNEGEKSLKFLMISSERVEKFFQIIKMILPHREKFYMKFSFDEPEQIKTVDETSDESDGFFAGILCEHKDYIETKAVNQFEKIFNLEVKATFFPMKSINLQIFGAKISDENKFRAKSFCEKFVRSNSQKIFAYNIAYNTSYFTISKDTQDFLFIFTDENFIDDIMKNDFENADKIMFWTEIPKAKELLKKYPKKIMVANKKFDFLLTPRFFMM